MSNPASPFFHPTSPPQILATGLLHTSQALHLFSSPEGTSLPPAQHARSKRSGLGLPPLMGPVVDQLPLATACAQTFPQHTRGFDNSPCSKKQAKWPQKQTDTGVSPSHPAAHRGEMQGQLLSCAGGVVWLWLHPARNAPAPRGGPINVRGDPTNQPSIWLR